jgi:hypothetical protein
LTINLAVIILPLSKAIEEIVAPANRSQHRQLKTPKSPEHSEDFYITPKKTSRKLNIRVKVPQAARFEIQLNSTSPTDKVLLQKKITIRQPEFKEPGSNIFSRSYDRILAIFQATTWSLEKVLFILAILVYLGTHLIKLDAFPIYFFTDEAVQTMLASDMLRDHGLNYDKEFLPTYFVNGNQYNLSTSVYLQVLPTILFNRSIDVTRGTAAMATLLAAFAVGLTMKRVFKSRFYWAATLLLLITPAWFLHSRTAFETALAVSFFAAFIYFYLLYRTENPKNLYPAMVMGALCFYSYSPAQVVMAVSAFLLLLSDIRYHWQNREVFLRAIGVGILLAIPYLRFLITHPDENYNHLVILQSYWVSDTSTLAKLQQFATNWLKGLDPGYWFVPNNADFVRHLMKGYGNLFRLSFPFLLFGIGLCFRYIKSSPHRALIILLLASPVGAALVEPGITRALFLVIPAVLLSIIGLNSILVWLERKHISHFLIALLLFTGMVSTDVYMLTDSLINGPTWFTDYGLGGMQWGAKQLFGKVGTNLKDHPNTKLIVSPSWANGTEVLSRFFQGDAGTFQLGSIDGYIESYKKIDPATEFVMIPEEYARALASPKFTDVKVDEILPYPDGSPGFFFVHLHYVDNIESVFAAETALYNLPVEGIATLPDGQTVKVQYSHLDMGQLYNLFDGDLNTVTRTEFANPFLINVTFSEPTLVSGITVRVGGVPTLVTVDLVLEGSDKPQHFEMQKGQTADPRDVVIDFGTIYPVTQAKIQVKSVNDTEPSHVHVWEITFLKP